AGWLRSTRAQRRVSRATLRSPATLPRPVTLRSCAALDIRLSSRGSPAQLPRSAPWRSVCQHGQIRVRACGKGPFRFVPGCGRTTPGRVPAASPTGDKPGKWNDRIMMRTDGNVLHHRQAEAAEGHDAFAALYDPTTIRHLEAVGVRPGWRCWGIGSTSLVSWLAKRVGPTGRVLATPVDTTWSAPAARPPVEILNHDIASGEPPAGGFDLVHARLPFVEAADRERAVRAMAAALRPGGHLLI